MRTSIGTIENYYGGLVVKEDGGKYFWCVENYTDDVWEEIPKYLYDTLISFEKERVCEHKNTITEFMGGSEYLVRCKDCGKILGE